MRTGVRRSEEVRMAGAIENENPPSGSGGNAFVGCFLPVVACLWPLQYRLFGGSSTAPWAGCVK